MPRVFKTSKLDTITILGTALGGTSPVNDLTLTVDAVDVNGAITTISELRTGLNSFQVHAITHRLI